MELLRKTKETNELVNERILLIKEKKKFLKVTLDENYSSKVKSLSPNFSSDMAANLTL